MDVRVCLVESQGIGLGIAVFLGVGPSPSEAGVALNDPFVPHGRRQEVGPIAALSVGAKPLDVLAELGVTLPWHPTSRGGPVGP